MMFKNLDTMSALVSGSQLVQPLFRVLKKIQSGEAEAKIEARETVMSFIRENADLILKVRPLLENDRFLDLARQFVSNLDEKAFRQALAQVIDLSEEIKAGSTGK